MIQGGQKNAYYVKSALLFRSVFERESSVPEYVLGNGNLFIGLKKIIPVGVEVLKKIEIEENLMMRCNGGKEYSKEIILPVRCVVSEDVNYKQTI